MPCLTLLQGRGAAYEALSRATAPGRFVCSLDPLAPVPWGGLRSLLAELRIRLGDAPVALALAPHRVLLSLVLRGLDAGLTREERHERFEQSYMCLYRLPNMLPVARHLREAWADVLAALLPHGSTLVFPSLLHLDLETTLTLRPLLCRRRADVTIVVGDDPDDRPRSSLVRETLDLQRADLVELRAVVGAEVTTVSTPGRRRAPPADARIDPLDDDLERRAFAALRGAEGIPGDDVCALVLGAIEAAFASFGHGTALFLAEELLRRRPLAPRAGFLHIVVGLASYAHNPEPFATEGASSTVRRAATHIRRALAMGCDPADAANLQYRLAMIAVRHRGNPAAGKRLATLAVTTARTVASPSHGAFLAARALAGRSLASVRLGRLPDVLTDCEAALAALEGARGSSDVPATEVRVAELVLSDNYSRACFAAGRREQTVRLQNHCLALLEGVPRWRQPEQVSGLFDGAEFNMNAAVRHLTVRLALARAELDAAVAAELAHHLGGLHYRRGDAAAAHRHFREAHGLWTAIQHDPAEILGAEQNRAVAALRTGLWDDAERGFKAVLASELVEDPGSRAEVNAAQALVAASRGDIRSADAHLRWASELARESAEVEVAVRVGRTQAEAALRLGRDEDARRLLQEAGASAESRDDEGNPLVPVEDRFGVYVGLLVFDPPASPADTLDRVLAAVRLAPRSLRDASA